MKNNIFKKTPGYLIYKNKIELFANKHKNRILKIHNSNITLQGKDYIIRIFWSGRVQINDKKIKFMFNPDEIEKYM